MKALRSIQLIFASVAACAAFAASGASLFKPVPIAKAERAPEGMVSPRAVAIDREAILATGSGGTLEATLPTGRTVSIAIDRIERNDNGDISWSGRVVDSTRTDLLAHGTSGESGTHGELQTPEGNWGIAPASAAHDWLFDRTSTLDALPHPIKADDSPRPPEISIVPRPKAVCPSISSMPSPQVTVDVLAVLAPDFVSTHGGAAGAESRLNFIFNAMNSFNAASNVAITYRRVGTMNASVGPSTAGDDSTVLNAITAGSGSFANVKALRDYYGADMVALFRGPNSASANSAGISGIAWLNGDGNGGNNDSSYMYSVSGDHPFFDGTLPSHELGHNLGNAHDRPNANNGFGSTNYAFGHFVCGTGASAGCGQAGFNDTGTGFGTIMSYHRPTVAKFSSPALSCKSSRSGSLTAPCGVADAQDDVRASNCVRQSVAAFKSSWVGNCNGADSDGDGIPDCIEANAGRVNGARDNDIFGNALLFSTQQYRDFLSREADADGLNFWMSALNNGTYSRGQMIENFFGSGEFQGTIAPVARLYFAYFLRIPDYAGLQYWIGQFRNGVPLGTISQSFATSAEFSSRYGPLNNTQFVTQVYQNVLGRAPDPQGLAYWVGQLNSGAMNRGAVMIGFSESPEYRALIGNEVYVTMIYSGMLKRSPDSGGFTYWVNQMDAGNPGLNLINGFLGSPEYRARFL